MSEILSITPDFEDYERYRERTLRIEGGHPLHGTIKEVGGAKNSGFKVMMAAALIDDITTLHNMPKIGDVLVTAKILTSLGATVEFLGDGTTVRIDARGLHSYKVPMETGEASRAAILAAGPLLAKFGRAEIPHVGGDKIGARPIDIHIEGLEALGAHVEVREDQIIFTAEHGLSGTEFRLKIPSHMGTENLIIASTKAKGKTRLINCAKEPEVDALVDFLNSAGAKITIDDSHQERVIEIEGVDTLHGTESTIMPDRKAVVTYGVAAITTKSQEGVLVKGANPNHIRSFLTLLDGMNGGYAIQDDGILFFSQGELVAPKLPVTTCPHPNIIPGYYGIMTDWQALAAVLFFNAKGVTSLVEKMYPNRFHAIEEARKAGAQIEWFDPRTVDPNIQYMFKESESGDHHGVKIIGNQPLNPMHIQGTDVRLGAFAVLMGLVTPGVSTVTDLRQIMRGYHNFVWNMQSIGARIAEAA